MKGVPAATSRIAGPGALAALLAIGLPALIAYNVPPSATFFNQAAAFIGWGVFLFLLTMRLPKGVWPRSQGMASLLVALSLLLLAAFAAPFWASLPWSLAWSNIGTILSAALVAIVAGALAETGTGATAFRAFCIGLVVAGVASAAIGVVQVYAPQWTDGSWIAYTSLAGRAVGNLRQPNHLSSLLLWSIVAAIWLGETRAWPRALTAPVTLALLFVVVLSGSRTGALGTLMLAAWGVLDRRLSRPARIALILAPLAYAVLWEVAIEWAHLSRHAFGGETRFSAAGDVSSSRFAIWSNTLDLIRAHPWFGVGYGEFNFAWTLTPFPDRPVAFFDHTHNLPLQFAVELGIPLAVIVLVALAWALVWATRSAVAAGRATAAGTVPFERAALVMVVMVAVHSLLEYPLWYAYFLLPTAFAWGLCLARPPALAGATAVDSLLPTTEPMQARRPAAASIPADVDLPPEVTPVAMSPETAPLETARMPSAAADLPRRPSRPLALASIALVLGGLFALYDYFQVVVIFAPPADVTTSLAERIAEGRQSLLFAHHADYAAATTVEHPSEALDAFSRAPHYLLDARLLEAWAKALHEAGDDERARYLARRLSEFHNDQSEAFFAPCVEPPTTGVTRPFQCQPPARPLDFEDFR
jgi:O-antigen ligase